MRHSEEDIFNGERVGNKFLTYDGLPENIRMRLESVDKEMLKTFI